MRKIAFIGTAASGVAAPVTDPSYEIWGVSARGPHISRADRWFELHRLDCEPADWAASWRQELREKVTHDCELMMLFPEPDLGPRVTAYPHERIVARFGSYFMTSSFAWMMALAIDELVPDTHRAPAGSTIAIYGVEMEYGTEYREQRAGFRHFIALAQALGITVQRLAQGGLIYEPVPYPMWQDDPLLCKVKLRIERTARTLEQCEQSLRDTHKLIAQNRGAAAEIDAMTAANGGWDAAQRLAALNRQFEGLLDMSARLGRDIATARGAFEEQNFMRDYLAP